jgi:hypothetical protein
LVLLDIDVFSVVSIPLLGPRILLGKLEVSNATDASPRTSVVRGVAVDNTNLSNFQLVDGRMMMMDLESAVFHYTADQRERYLASNIKHLAGMYRDMQAYYRFDGCLEAA